MSDVYCARCGEPWDSYSLQPGIVREGESDLGDARDVRRFRQGKGCPSCGWGTKCPICEGSGRDGTCKTCPGTGRLHASALDGGPLMVGYQPNMRRLPPDTPRLEIIDRYRCLDGPVVVYLVSCPDCSPLEQSACEACRGSGKPRAFESDEAADELAIAAAASDLDSSDEEPVGILIRRGLL